jgi:protein disulfide isomerase
MTLSLLLCLVAVVASAIVEELNEIETSIIQRGDAALVSFVAGWCPHCQRLKGELPTLATRLQDLGVRVVTVDCVANAATCASASVSGYPTIKFVHGAKVVKFSQRQRDAGALEAFVRRIVGPLVEIVRDADNLAQFRALSPRDAVLMGVSRDETTALKALLEDAAARLNAHDDESVRVALMLDASVPADGAHVVLLRSFDEPRLFYDGASDDGAALYAWVRAHRKPLLDKHKKGVYSSKEPIVFLHRDITDGARDDSDVVDAVREASRQLRAEPVAFAWLDKNEWDGVRAGLSGKRYPALTIDDIRFVNRRYAYDENAAITTPDVVAWVQKLLAGQLAHTNFSQPLALAADNAAATVKVLVLDNFADLVERRSTNLFVMFHSPTCGTCQSLYAPFDQLARHYAGDARITFLKGESWMNDFPEWLRLSGVPDLRFFGANSGRVSREFEGNDRSFDKMRQWLDKQLQQSPTTPHDEL